MALSLWIRRRAGSDPRGSVVRAYLGVSLDRSFNPVQATKLGLTRQRGARITDVTARSPAETAKLRVALVPICAESQPWTR